MAQLLQGDDLLTRLDDAQRRLLQEAESRREVLAQSIAVTGGLSIGYVIWLVRGGVLMSSMLSALPAWQMVDPLPVLAASGARARIRRNATMAKDDDVEHLFDGQDATRTPLSRPLAATRAQAAPPVPVPAPIPVPVPAPAAPAEVEALASNVPQES
jgi:hypothetical protein